jgi:aryl-alcohol dehydrogenase-like predicted oxidoreductase
MLALAELVEAGKIRAAGVSNFSVAQMEEAESVFSFVANQVPYSMVNRGIEAGVLPHCIARNKAVLAYSPLQRGLLTGKFTAAHTFKAGDHRGENEYFTAENIQAVNVFLDAIRPIAEAHNATLSQLVIAWTIAQPGITSALVGARDAEQALANAKAGALRLTPDDLATIGRELDALRLEGV